MTSENIEVIRDQFAATNERDFGRAMGHYDADVELVVHPNAFLQSGTYSGRDAVGAYFGDWFATFEPGYHLEIEDARDFGHVVFLQASHDGHGRASGAAVSGRTGYLYTLRERKIVRVEMFATAAEALESASGS